MRPRQSLQASARRPSASLKARSGTRTGALRDAERGDFAARQRREPARRSRPQRRRRRRPALLARTGNPVYPPPAPPGCGEPPRRKTGGAVSGTRRGGLFGHRRTSLGGTHHEQQDVGRTLRGGAGRRHAGDQRLDRLRQAPVPPGHRRVAAHAAMLAQAGIITGDGAERDRARAWTRSCQRSRRRASPSRARSRTST